MKTIREEFQKNSIYRLDESLRMVTSALGKISEEDIWKKPNKNLNSVGNLILHLCGNLTQYGYAALGNHPDRRERDAEFAVSGGWDKDQLLRTLQNTVDKVKQEISNCTEENWLAEKEVQGFTLSGVGLVLHTVEHFSYHTGQIAFIVKQQKNINLGYYEGADLNANKSD